MKDKGESPRNFVCRDRDRTADPADLPSRITPASEILARDRHRGFQPLFEEKPLGKRRSHRTARVEAKSRGGDTHVAYAASNERL